MKKMMSIAASVLVASVLAAAQSDPVWVKVAAAGSTAEAKAAADFDRTHAHKPWVLKHDGVVYHYYCAVGGKGRGIALATSEP